MSMEDLFEEIYLDEDLPKDLAKAFRNSFERPRDADSSKHARGYGNIETKPDIDFKNSTYTEITPDEAIQLYKSGDSRNVLAIIDGQLANTYLKIEPDGTKKRAYDFKAVGSGEAFKKENGKIGNNSMWLSPKEFYNNASKIYVANEVEVDPNLRARRAENPESKYNSSFFNSKKVLPRKKSAVGIHSDQISFDSNGNARYDSSYTGDNTYNGKRMSRNEYYPVDAWEIVHNNFISR